MVTRLCLTDRGRRRLLLAGIALASFALWLGVFLKLKPATPRMTIDTGGGPGTQHFSPDSRFLITHGTTYAWGRASRSPGLRAVGSIRIHNLTTGQSVGSFAALNEHLDGLHVSPDGRHVFVRVATSREWRFFEIDKEQKLVEFSIPGGAQRGLADHPAFAPDGRLVALGVNQHFTDFGRAVSESVVIWDLSERRDLWNLKGFRGPVCFSPDGAILATCRAEKDAPAKCVVQLWDPKKGAKLDTLEGPDLEPLHLEFSPDGRFLAALVQMNEGWTAGKPSKPTVLYPGVVLWSVESGRLVKRWPRARLFSFLADDDLLCVHRGNQGWDFAVEHYRLPSGDDEPELVWQRQGHRNSYTGRYELTFRTDTWRAHPLRQWAVRSLLGKELPEHRETTSIQLIDWQENSRQIELDGRASAQLSPDEKTLLVSHLDGRVELYDVPPDRPIAPFAVISAITSLLFTLALWWRFVR